MTISRDKILSRIRESLRRGELSHSEKAKLAEQMNCHSRGILPKRAALPHPDLVNLFIEQTQAALATVYQLQSLSDVSSIVFDYLKSRQLILSICISNDSILDSIEWHSECVIKKELPTPYDLVSVTSSFCGVAETGTLVLLSSPESPTTLNFLPEIHFVLLSAKNIVAYYEDAWDLIRAKNLTPRTVNFITGPSRTADIEQTVQIGMHGPKQVFILLYP